MLQHDHDPEGLEAPYTDCLACIEEQSITKDMSTEERVTYIIDRLVNEYNMDHRTPEP